MSSPSAGPPGDIKDFALQNSDSSSNSTEADALPAIAQDAPPIALRMPPSLRASSDPHGVKSMTASSQPLGIVNNARKPPSLSAARAGGGGLPQNMQDKMKAFHLSRQGTPPGGRPGMGGGSISVGPPPGSPKGGGVMPGVPSLSGGLRLPQGMRPQAHNFSSAPAVPRAGAKPSLSERRGKMNLGGLPGGPPGALPTGNGQSDPAGQDKSSRPDSQSGSMFTKFSEFVDTKAGTLKFAGKAVIHSGGVDFSNGNSFSISLDEVDTMEELGKGNYGTVYKVRHARPKMRRPGLGLSANKSSSPLTPTDEKDLPSSLEAPSGNLAVSSISGPTGIVMAMKEIRLELDEAKFAAIIMELDVLHRCISPYIVDFYGAFFQEGAVYICLEFMDGGSIDKLYGDGIPESILRKITYATTVGLRSLKDEHNIIHRDVKPTNILVNSKGQVKICDFGVSGNLVASIAKTNIGCQSYMAPERISGGGVAQAGANPGGGTYSVQSDIWSLGLTIIECAMGRYPYPPETYNNIFSQLSAIVDGDPPDLPVEGYSSLARDFVRGCLNKIPKLRPTYAMLLQHGWLAPLSKPATICEDEEGDTSEHLGIGEDRQVAQWVQEAIQKKVDGKMDSSAKPALHAAPLDTVSPATSPNVGETLGMGDILS